MGSKVLVDSSVWIEFFRSGTDHSLPALIGEDLVCTNDIVLTELVPSLLKTGNKEAAESLLSFEKIELSVDWEIIRAYQLLNLKNGLNKVGIADLLILQQVIFSKVALFTFDKHFSLMKNHLEFELFNA